LSDQGPWSAAGIAGRGPPSWWDLSNVVGSLSERQGTHYSHVCKGTPYDHEVENPLADIDDIERITDPGERARQAGERLAAVPAWQERLRKIRQAAVLEMRAQRMSYQDIGNVLGLHRNRIQQIAEGRPGGGKGAKPGLGAGQ
jgi:hypothetical protein